MLPLLFRVVVAEGDGEGDARFPEEVHDFPGHQGEGLLVPAGFRVVSRQEGQVRALLGQRLPQEGGHVFIDGGDILDVRDLADAEGAVLMEGEAWEGGGREGGNCKEGEKGGD